MSNPESVEVEVAYAAADGAFLRTVHLPVPANVRGAIEASGLLAACPEVDLARNRVGIWSRFASPEDAVSEGDRVEVYRPLVADPKDARRSRAAERRNRG
jgi:putative ubiquitin-RnfH superfamily antitoxin RatB of RatAB toxin-antitoxin module